MTPEQAADALFYLQAILGLNIASIAIDFLREILK